MHSAKPTLTFTLEPVPHVPVAQPPRRPTRRRGPQSAPCPQTRTLLSALGAVLVASASHQQRPYLS